MEALALAIACLALAVNAVHSAFLIRVALRSRTRR